MKFSREITKEEMKKIATDTGVVYVLLQATNEHGLVNKGLYRLTSLPVRVDGIEVDPETDEWSFKLRDSQYEECLIYPTLSDVNEKIKKSSEKGFWEVVGNNEVVGWNMPEAVVIESKQITEDMLFRRGRMGIEPPSRDWKALVKGGQRDLEKISDEGIYKAYEADLIAFEKKARAYYNDKSPL